MTIGTEWKILVVEDNEELGDQLIQAIPNFIQGPDKAQGELCKNFNEAIQALMADRFDVVILDLKDDSGEWEISEGNQAGLDVFEKLKETRFIPVVFYTALAHLVRHLETSFVRIVEKTEGIEKVKEEILHILDTKLPALTRRVEEIQRSYMWNFVSDHWQEFDAAHQKVDIAYLLARRMALSLQQEAKHIARELVGEAVPITDTKKVHPMEMYVQPPINENCLAGDILKGEANGVSGFWLVLTPSCDFERPSRIDCVLLTQCVPLRGEAEYLNWACDQASGLESLKQAIIDRRKNKQSERYKFLPGTFFLPDSFVDFQKLQTVSMQELRGLRTIASLDSPFAEAVLAQFSRYFGRLGTPDLDVEIVINRLEEDRAPGPTEPAPPN
jgi:CheY-like chemotaxis protein